MRIVANRELEEALVKALMVGLSAGSLDQQATARRDTIEFLRLVQGG